MERVQLENSDSFIIAHGSDQCSFPERCVIHNRSAHIMRGFPQHWRGDRGLMERICEHGVGHPDPDHLYFVENTLGTRAAEVEAVHGCCGVCCSEGAANLDPVDSLLEDVYSLVFNHFNRNPQKAANWCHDEFGAPDGFVDWIIRHHRHLVGAWANGYYDE